MLSSKSKTNGTISSIKQKKSELTKKNSSSHNITKVESKESNGFINDNNHDNKKNLKSKKKSMQSLKLKEVINLNDTKYNKKTISDLNLQKISDLKKDKNFLISVQKVQDNTIKGSNRLLRKYPETIAKLNEEIKTLKAQNKIYKKRIETINNSFEFRNLSRKKKKENVIRYAKNELIEKRENLMIEIDDLKTELQEKNYEIEKILAKNKEDSYKSDEKIKKIKEETNYYETIKYNNENEKLKKNVNQLNEELEQKNNELLQKNRDIEEKDKLINKLKKKIFDANMKSFNKHKTTDKEPTLEQIKKEEKYNFFSRKIKSQSSNSLHATKKGLKEKLESDTYSIYHGKVINPSKEIKTLTTSLSQSSLKIPDYIKIHSLDKKPRNKDDAVNHIKTIAHSLNKYKYLYKNYNNNNSNESNQSQSTLPSLHIKNTKKKDKISISKEIEKKQLIKNMSMGEEEMVESNKVVKNPLINNLPPLTKNSSSMKSDSMEDVSKSNSNEEDSEQITENNTETKNSDLEDYEHINELEENEDDLKEKESKIQDTIEINSENDKLSIKES